MAQIIEERITIKISRMVADGDTTIDDSKVTDEIKEQLGVIAEELVGGSVIVEVYTGE